MWVSLLVEQLLTPEHADLRSLQAVIKNWWGPPAVAGLARVAQIPLRLRLSADLDPDRQTGSG